MIEKEKIKSFMIHNLIKYGSVPPQKTTIKYLFAEGLKKQEIPEIIPAIKKAEKEVNKLKEKHKDNLKQLEKFAGAIKKRKQRQGLPDLPDAEQGKVVVRFAPFPSGPLHIGNTRQLILNDEYAKKYNGKLILVIDDTIGSQAKPIAPEAYDLIKQGVKWLNIKHDKKIIYKSDRLQTYYDFAEELIKKGYMYVCSCSQEEIKELRTKGIDCSCRHLPGTEQMKRWKQMFKQETKPGDFTVRLKTSMQHPNPAFRDRVMFRISDRKHPRVKNKYRVWPLLEFSWAIDDHLLGITHIIRGIDLIMETKIEEFIWDIFQWKKPTTIHTGFFSIQNIKLSKSKGAQEVHSGKYIGWDDPRTWSLQSLEKRGIHPQAIREFILNMGITKVNSKIAIEVLYAINKKLLENSKRYFFVPNPVKIHIKGAPEIKAELPLNPNENIGHRKYKTSQEFFMPKQDLELMHNGNYRLMHLFNFKTDSSALRTRDFHFISQEPDNKLEIKTIQWLPADKENEKNNIKTTIRMPDNSIISGLSEPEILKLKPKTIIKFERFGFVKLDKLDKKQKTTEFWFAHP